MYSITDCFAAGTVPIYWGCPDIGRFFDLDRTTIETRIDELVPFVQLGDKIDVNVRNLSGGMKRRLLIARSLINAPQVLVLDEPTTGLDPQARHLVWEKLRRLLPH